MVINKCWYFFKLLIGKRWCISILSKDPPSNMENLVILYDRVKNSPHHPTVFSQRRWRNEKFRTNGKDNKSGQFWAEQIARQIALKHEISRLVCLAGEYHGGQADRVGGGDVNHGPPLASICGVLSPGQLYKSLPGSPAGTNNQGWNLKKCKFISLQA